MPILSRTFSRSRHIHDLPNEILVIIFLFAITKDYKIPVKLTEVCKLWREIARGNACLWTEISGWSATAREVVLALSNGRPLTYSGGMTEKHPNDALFVSKVAARLEVLGWLDASSSFGPVNVAVLLDAGTYLRLKILRLENQSRRLKYVPFDCPRNFFVPVLESLHLASVHLFLFKCVSFRALRTLKLQRRIGLNISDLSTVLANTPVLETLILDETLISLDTRLDTRNDAPSPLPDHLSPVQVPVTNITWHGIPPGLELHRLFRFLPSPRLRSLDLTISPTINDFGWFTLEGLIPCETERTHPHGCSLDEREEPVVLAHLEELTVRVGPKVPFSWTTSIGHPWARLRVLKNLLLPSLTTLVLACDAPQVPEDGKNGTTSTPTPATEPTSGVCPSLPRLEDLFSTDSQSRLSGPATLSTLRLHHIAMNLSDSRAFLDGLPALNTLVLDSCPGSSALVCALAPKALPGAADDALNPGFRLDEDDIHASANILKAVSRPAARTSICP